MKKKRDEYFFEYPDFNNVKEIVYDSVNKYPDNTAETVGKPLVKMFQGSLVVIGDTIAVDEFLKDKVTLYRTSKVEESDGFPTV